MSCVILVASITPCNDAIAFNQKQVTVAIKATPPHDCKGNADVCSPLCVCNCCAGCSMYYSVPHLNSFNAQSPVNYASFLISNTHKVALPIWQPPQLV